jgi:phenylacetate-CoA ligase
MRIKGWLGRADQTTKVKGMFVHPGRWWRWSSVTRARPGRLVVDQPGQHRPHDPALRSGAPVEELAEAIAAVDPRLTKLRGEVSWSPRAAWPTTAR